MATGCTSQDVSGKWSKVEEIPTLRRELLSLGTLTSPAVKTLAELLAEIRFKSGEREPYMTWGSLGEDIWLECDLGRGIKTTIQMTSVVAELKGGYWEPMVTHGGASWGYLEPY